MPPRPTPHTLPAYAFLSGAAALIYELVWLRELALVYGVSSLATATIAGVYLAGLGLGAHLAGTLTPRLKNPQKAWGLLEAAIALFAAGAWAALTATDAVQTLYASLYTTFDLYTVSLARLGLSAAILLPATLAIGGTLPVMAKLFITDTKTLARRFCDLYAANTAGAVAGTLATGFLLIRYLGVSATFACALAVNLALAIALLASSPNTPLLTRGHTRRQTTAPHRLRTGWLAVLFASGFVALGYEIAWTRILTIHSSATTYVYTIILAGFLTGFACGARLASRYATRLTVAPKTTLALLAAAIGLAGSVVLLVFSTMPAIHEALLALINTDAVHYHPLVAEAVTAYLVTLVPALAMGAFYPLAFTAYAKTNRFVGKKAGTAALANAAGAVAGSLATGFLFIPFAGITKSILVLAGIAFLAAAYAGLRALRTGESTPHMRRHLPAILAACILATLIFGGLAADIHEKGDYPGRLIYYEEGLSATVSVKQYQGLRNEPVRALLIDGQGVADTDVIGTVDSKMLAHLPLLLHGAPREVATVGYGTGGTSYSMLLHDVDVTAVEIEEKVLEASEYFPELNRDTQDHENLTLVFDDARSYLAAADGRFDVIVTDVTNLKYKSNSWLYSRDYFRIMRDALKPDGLAAAWVPLGGISPSDLAMLLSGFQDVYPHTTVWHYNQGFSHFLVVVGTPRRLSVNVPALKAGMSQADVAADLAAIDVDDEYELSSMLLLGEDDVRRFVGNAPPHTDDRPRLEYSDIKHYFLHGVEDNLDRLTAQQRENRTAYFTGQGDDLERLAGRFQLESMRRRR